MSGAFLEHFIEYALLNRSGGTPPCIVHGFRGMGSPVADNGFRAFQRAKNESSRSATKHY